MADFVQSFTTTLSADGYTITIEDTSNWTDAGLNKVDFIRTFTLNDSVGATLDTITIPSTTDVATYILDKDRWISIVYDIIGTPAYNKTQNYSFNRIFLNKLQKALINNKCCTDKTTVYNINTANTFYQAAVYIFPTGNASATQSDLDAANSYINLVI